MTEYYIKEDRYVPVTKPFFYGWKNAMQLGALKDGKIVEVCKVASGLNDLLRSSMADNPDNYIGQVVEIECMSVNKKDGTVRHPVFKRIREDKDSQDCLYNEIFS
jgi:ATP-dependent DNA ligase